LSKLRGKRSKRVLSPGLILLVIGLSILGVGALIILSNQAGPVDVSNFPAKGAANAPVTMIEYVDYGCSHCRAFTLETFPLLDAEYIQTGKVKFVIHPFYLGNPQMGLAAEAAWCAADQGKFFEYHHALFANTEAIVAGQSGLIDLAATEGLNRDTFGACLSSRQHQAELENARQAAENRGINSTPTFYVNNQRILGNEPYSIFQRVINQELSK
jgi:protein-disulfide isomerase